MLAAAGLLTGKRATSNWQAIEQLSGLGAEVEPERVVFDGKLATSAGVTAGIDMALDLATKIGGDQLAQAIQLGLESDPEPPSTPARHRRRLPRSSRLCAPTLVWHVTERRVTLRV